MAPLASGILSGARSLAFEALQVRVERIAAGLVSMGVARGDCVAILMRNDIAFLEAAYAAQRIGAYSVPINWHFKADEIAHILADCGAKVLFAHADLILALALHLPAGVAMVGVATPPEVAAAYGVYPVAATAVAGTQDFEAFIAQEAPYAGPQLSAPLA